MALSVFTAPQLCHVPTLRLWSSNKSSSRSEPSPRCPWHPAWRDPAQPGGARRPGPPACGSSRWPQVPSSSGTARPLPGARGRSASAGRYCSQVRTWKKRGVPCTRGEGSAVNRPQRVGAELGVDTEGRRRPSLSARGRLVDPWLCARHCHLDVGGPFQGKERRAVGGRRRCPRGGPQARGCAGAGGGGRGGGCCALWYWPCGFCVAARTAVVWAMDASRLRLTRCGARRGVHAA